MDSVSDTLLTLAEIAVGLAGFSSVVVIFKRREGGSWRLEDADRFNGMILHAVAAVLLCLVPMVLEVFTGAGHAQWVAASGLLGLQVAGHSAAIVALSSTGPIARWAVLGTGLAVAALQGANALGLGAPPRAGPYVVGVVWHLVLAGGLFVALVWVPSDSVDGR